MTLSLSQRRQKRLLERGFMRRSTIWSVAGMWVTYNDWLRTFSQTKKMSSSICLVRECSTWLWASATVLWLSQWITRGVHLMWSSFKKDCSQRSSYAVIARLRYSASVLERATNVCFLDHQEIKLGPKKIQAPKVDQRSSISDAQSTSQ